MNVERSFYSMLAWKAIRRAIQSVQQTVELYIVVGKELSCTCE